MIYHSEYYWKHSWDVCTQVLNNSEFLHVCQSVSWLTSSQKLGLYRVISSFWWDIFLNFFEDIIGIFLQYFKTNTNCLHLCQSDSWLTSLLKLDKCRDVSCSGWVIFLKFFWDIPEMFVHFFPNFHKILVCMSVF